MTMTARRRATACGTPGTSTVNATGYCEFDDYYGYLSRECNITVNSYS